MTPDRQPSNILETLGQRIQPNQGDYDVVVIAEIIYELLLDDRARNDLFNGDKRTTFMVLGHELPIIPGVPAPSLWFGSVDPDFAPPGHRIPLIELSIDDFLNHTVVYHEGTEFSVADIVGFLASKGGAVHLEQPKDEKQRVLLHLTMNLQPLGRDIIMQAILSIGRVVHKGLQPPEEMLNG